MDNYTIKKVLNDQKSYMWWNPIYCQGTKHESNTITYIMLQWDLILFPLRSHLNQCIT